MPTLDPVSSAPENGRFGPAFAQALRHVLAMEGGYTDDPLDPGGPTNLGLTLSDLAQARHVELGPQTRAALLDDLKSLSPTQASPIYYDHYWLPCRAEALPTGLAFFHFDAAVNHGLAAAARMLQEALSITVDGQLGYESLHAANRCAQRPLLTRYAQIRCARYRSLPGFPHFGHGWLARVDATLAAASALIGVTTPSMSSPHPKSTGDPSMTDASPASSSNIPAASPLQLPKWWGNSMTIWGTAITVLATVAPVLSPILGLPLTPEMVHQIADQISNVAQAIVGLIGAGLAIYGRARATQPLHL